MNIPPIGVTPLWDDKLQSAWMPGKRFVWGVQWHPEYMFKADTNSLKLFEAFVQACNE